MSLRTGITTGTCAAAAAKAACMVLCGHPAPARVQVLLPRGEIIEVPLLYAKLMDSGRAAVAAVRKDAGDDPDVTDGMEIAATVSFASDGDIAFHAGEGVGTITKPGLSISPGEPAINPVPRHMIRAAVREVTSRPLCIEISMPGGRTIAARTFNPRLGIEGGLSILGTTGIVRPYCVKALHDALKCSLDVAAACGVTALVLVPGNIGAKAAHSHFRLREEQLVEVGNEWGFILDQVRSRGFRAILLAGHPGKVAKLASGQWDTHSSRSASATPVVARLFEQVFQRPAPNSPTVEGFFAALAEDQRRRLGDALAQRISTAVADRLAQAIPVATFLVNMAGQCIGVDGDLSPWQ